MEPGLKQGAFYDPTNFTFPAALYREMEVDAPPANFFVTSWRRTISGGLINR